MRVKIRCPHGRAAGRNGERGVLLAFLDHANALTLSGHIPAICDLQRSARTCNACSVLMRRDQAIRRNAGQDEAPVSLCQGDSRRFRSGSVLESVTGD